MPSLCLSLVPVAVLKTSDDINIGARLEGMEMGMKKLTEALGKIAAEKRPAVCTGNPVLPIVQVSEAAPGAAGPAVTHPQPGASVSFVQGNTPVQL